MTYELTGFSDSDDRYWAIRKAASVACSRYTDDSDRPEAELDPYLRLNV